MYHLLIKPFLFLLQPEKAHHFTLKMLKLILAIPGFRFLFKKLFAFQNPLLKTELLGLTFNNPVGLAAGFDKDGKHYRTMASLGFGYIEIGTVTPKAQIGNPQPRMFRLKSDQAVINRMGFNNEGVDAMVKRLKDKPIEGLIIGGNIGKNKITPNEEAFRDYEICFEKLFPYVNYFVVNVSSPNTPGLRDLQEKEPLTRLLQGIQVLNNKKDKPKPVLLKIAPDLTDGQLDDIIGIVQDTQIAGLIATNTTIDRSNLQTSKEQIDKIGNGGLSGKPLTQRSTEVIRYLHQKSKGAFPIIAVGGIHSPQTAWEKLEAGASLIQIYTGLVYEGPFLIKKINKYILEKKKYKENSKK